MPQWFENLELTAIVFVTILVLSWAVQYVHDVRQQHNL